LSCIFSKKDKNLKKEEEEKEGEDKHGWLSATLSF
jgi:hypothetical protein